MRHLVTRAALLALLTVVAAPPGAGARQEAQPSPMRRVDSKAFPYPIHHQRLANGLDLIVIPTPEFRELVAFTTAVWAGSRNETEKGKTGLAHLFEHIMFRHEFGGVPGGYDEQIRRMGAYNNAFTTYDLTFYHPNTFTRNLVGPLERPGGAVRGLIELEASRFKNLTVSEETFRTEAGAVLGEYRRNFADPAFSILEKTGAVAFADHPYGHTVIGLREDVENMPNASAAAWEFFRSYYTPNNSALIVAGDVDPAAIAAEVERWYADWKPRPTPLIPPAGPPDGEKHVHVPWDADVSPRVAVSYRTPAMNPASRESIVNLLLGELLVSRSAPLFRKLRYEKQSVAVLTTFGLELSTDPHLLMIVAELHLDRFRKEGRAYPDEVRDDIIAGIEDLNAFSKQPNAAGTLKVIQSKLRNDLLGALSSPDAIATTFARFYRYGRDPRVFDVLLGTIEALTPADIDAYAQKYFTPERRIVTTLWGPGGPKAGAEAAR
ncbi:MAG TPA: pitrilysin family protein [Vicinamibacterales bacterium]|nr:pitrilysin family protein [Vicinamibacterales bacterium]